MSDENAGKELDEEKREIDQDLESMEEQGERMEGDLEDAEAHSDDVEVPDPADSDAPGVDEDDIPEGEGEAAEEAGQ